MMCVRHWARCPECCSRGVLPSILTVPSPPPAGSTSPRLLWHLLRQPRTREVSVSPRNHGVSPAQPHAHYNQLSPCICAWMFSEPVGPCLPKLETILCRPLLLRPPFPHKPPASLSIVETLTTDIILPCDQRLSFQIRGTVSFASSESPRDRGPPCLRPWSCPSLASSQQPRQAPIDAIVGFPWAPAPCQVLARNTSFQEARQWTSVCPLPVTGLKDPREASLCEEGAAQGRLQHTVWALPSSAASRGPNAETPSASALTPHQS